ncbi:PUA-like domain-containing protein [Schizophyllum fasciatum]
MFMQYNASLKKSCETKRPVRVIRGFKLDSVYAPAEGYRYDGLYTVEKAYRERGLQGFLVCKFALKRVPGQPPLPIRSDDDDGEPAENEEDGASENASDGEKENDAIEAEGSEGEA